MKKYTELILWLRSASECCSVARRKYTELLLRLRSAREMIFKAEIS